MKVILENVERERGLLVNPEPRIVVGSQCVILRTYSSFLSSLRSPITACFRIPKSCTSLKYYNFVREWMKGNSLGQLTT